MAIKVQDWKAEADKLDFDGIEERLVHLEQLRENKLAQRRRSALDQIKEIMGNNELTIEDVVADHQPAKKAPSSGRKMAPKYRNPNDQSQTWSGQGIAPRWMPENKEQWPDFLIKAE